MGTPLFCKGENMVQTYKPEKEECMPDKRIFLARAGAKYSTLARDQLIKKINSLFLEAYDQIDPVVWYSFFEKSELPKELIPDTFENVGKITIFLSTLGKKIDMLIEYYSDSGKTFESLIVDSWASESLEKLNENVDRKFREQFGAGTMRFSPGYGNVDMRMNKYIVERLLRADQVKVLESGVMIPRKTTTCMIGWLSV
jgi:hypothetical protein